MCMKNHLLAACILLLPNGLQAQNFDGDFDDVTDLVAQCEILTADSTRLENFNGKAVAAGYCAGWYNAIASMLYGLCEMDDITEGDTFPPGLKSSAINNASPVVMHSHVLERLKREPALHAAPVTVVVSATLSVAYPCE